MDEPFLCANIDNPKLFDLCAPDKNETEEYSNDGMENKQEENELTFLENPFSTFFIDGVDSEKERSVKTEQLLDNDSYLEIALCVVILIDHSESVATHIVTINNALHDYYQEILEDDVLSQRIEMAVVSCNPELGIIQQPSLVENFTMPFIGVSRKTNLIAGVQMAIGIVKQRMQFYRENGIPYKRPWIIILSNGMADTEMSNINLKQIVDIRHDTISNNNSFIQPISISDDAQMDFFEMISTANAINIKDVQFSFFFR